VERRARRFCLGAEIPDGVLAFKSKHKPMPLSEIEQLIVLSTMGGVTGWHFAIMRHARYAPNLSNYCGSPVGCTFPSAAGFITSELFFTDDDGIYFFPTRDFHPEIEIHDGKVDLQEFLAVHKKRIKKLSNKTATLLNSEIIDMLELFELHDQIFLLNGDEVYKLHVTKENVHKLFLNYQ
jgi:hypothetical protein